MPRNNPAAPPVTGGIIRTTVQISSQSQIYEYVFDYMASTMGAISIATMQQFLTTFRTNVEVLLRPTLTTTTLISQYMAQEVVFAMLPPQTLAPTNPAGTITGAALNGMIAVVNTKQSGLRGQHGRGRWFAGPVPASFQSATDPNLLGGTGVSAYNALNGALLTQITVGALAFNMAISTRPIAPLTKVANAVFVSSIVVQLLLGTVRRRKEGRGI